MIISVNVIQNVSSYTPQKKLPIALIYEPILMKIYMNMQIY